MLLLPFLALLFLALLLFGAGFALRALWVVAVVVLVFRERGFMMRSAGVGGKRSRRNRW
ncbi:hydrophobic protein [Streptomyces sp. NPDC048434]|uniref:hydrophobic protein n=1 Tax=Streptomyces sp. NPDC048434 TaxID=3365549 RepID=UPI00371C2D4E